MSSGSRGTSAVLVEKTFPWSDGEICSETAPPAGHSGNDAHPFSGDPRISELTGVQMAAVEPYFAPGTFH